MTIALLLYGAGIYLSLCPAKSGKNQLLLVHIWAILCLITIMLYIILTPEITQASDFARYERYYRVLRVGAHGVDFEAGFVAIAGFFSALGVSFRVFVSIIAAFVLLSVYYFINCLFKKEDVALVSLVYLNYFALYNVLFNALRSGIAIAFVLMAVIACLRTRWFMSLCLILVSTTFHLSGAFAFPVLLTRIRLLKVWHCVAAVIVVFAGSYFGINKILFGMLFSASDIFYDNLSYYHYSQDLTARYPSYNRIDFLAFSSIPFFIHGLNSFLVFIGRFKNDNSTLRMYTPMVKSYALLLIAFCAFAYMPYSDRFALQAWLLWPVVIMWPTIYMFKNMIADTWILRAVVSLFIIFLPNLIGYQETLLTVSSAVEKALVGYTSLW